METTTIQNDIKLLTLTELLAQANSLIKEIQGLDYVYISSYGTSIELDPEYGQKSLLCFIAGKDSYNSDKATLKINSNISISFKIPPKPVAEDVANDVVEEPKAA